MKTTSSGDAPETVSNSRVRWRSSVVALAALGATAGLAGCSPQPEYRRNGYSSRADCLRDYPSGPCEGSRGGGGHFYGPWYGRGQRALLANDPGPGTSAVNGRSQLADPSASVTRRGGFGSTGRAGGYRGG